MGDGLRPNFNWKGKRVVIIGAARQGIALARYLARQRAHVVLNDRRPLDEFQSQILALSDLSGCVEWVCGGHPLNLLEGTDLVCVSGGVPLDIPLIQEASRCAIPISNDSQIFLEVAPCKVIGITGSAGKTTTTSLVGAIAQTTMKAHIPTVDQDKQPKVWVGGNIGSPLINQVEEMSSADLAIMELSSFQLEIMTRSPHIAVVLNITPNHLDRHGTMEAYTAAKAHILDYQNAKQIAILSWEDPGAWSLAGRVQGRLLTFGIGKMPDQQEGVFCDHQAVILRTSSVVEGNRIENDQQILARQDIRLRGEHNLKNVAAACAIAYAADLPISAMREGVTGFQGIPHRLEFVRSWSGADWYNDSIATAPERAIAAMRSFDEPLVLLAGGRDKNLPWEEFASIANQRVKHLILFGEAANLIQKAIDKENHERSQGFRQYPNTIHCPNLEAAVQAASQIVQPGDVVLLSPGGTSFDEFQDFEERGECYVRLVKELP